MSSRARRRVDQQEEEVIDLVEKAVFTMQRIPDDFSHLGIGSNGAAALEEEDLDNHPVLHEGMILVKCKAQGVRLGGGRRYVWVDAAGLHWVNAKGKPARDLTRGKVMALHDIERVSADAEGAKGGDATVFTVFGLDKTTLLFKVPKQKGRTAEQAKFIATFWVRSLQKLVNSLNAVGRLVNGTESTITLSHAQVKLRQKMEKSGILVARKLATKPYFKWFHRIFLEDHVLFFVKECLVTDVVDDVDIEALYERELYEKDRIAARAARAERRTLRAARERTRRQLAENRAAAGLDPLDDESDSNDSEGGTTATSESVEVTVGEAADDIDTAKLVTVTRELPAMFELPKATHGFNACPILPSKKKDLKRMSVALVHANSKKSVNFIIPTRSAFSEEAVLEAQAEADALVAVLRHQIQHHVPPTWLQTPMADENAPGNDSGGDLMDSVDGIIHTIEQRVNESRLRTFFELIGRSKQFSPKIPELLARNRGNEEAFFAALSKRYGCTVTPYRKVDDHLLDAYREVMGPSKPYKITTTL